MTVTVTKKGITAKKVTRPVAAVEDPNDHGSQPGPASPPAQEAECSPSPFPHILPSCQPGNLCECPGGQTYLRFEKQTGTRMCGLRNQPIDQLPRDECPVERAATAAWMSRCLNYRYQRIIRAVMADRPDARTPLDAISRALDLLEEEGRP